MAVPKRIAGDVFDAARDSDAFQLFTGLKGRTPYFFKPVRQLDFRKTVVVKGIIADFFQPVRQLDFRKLPIVKGVIADSFDV